MPKHRKEKVSAQLKRVVSELIERDLTEKYGLITIIDTDLTNDFKEAKIYVSIFNEKSRKEVISILNSRAPQYQFELGRVLKIKFIPRIEFKIADLSQIEKIDKLLEDTKSES